MRSTWRYKVFNREDAVKTAGAMLSEARRNVPGSGDKLIIVMHRYKISPEEIAATSSEIKKIARNAIIERTIAFVKATEFFRRDFEALCLAADFTAGQRAVADRLKRAGITNTLTNEALAFRIIE